MTKESVTGDVLNGLQDVGRLRQDDFFQHRRIRDRGIQCRDPPHRSIEVLEQLIDNAGGELGAEAARQLIFVRDDDSVGVLDRRRDGVPIERCDRPQVDHHDAEAILLVGP